MKGDSCMKKKRFSVEQIVAVLKQAALGVPVAEVIRKVGISEQTFIDGRSNRQHRRVASNLMAFCEAGIQLGVPEGRRRRPTQHR